MSVPVIRRSRLFLLTLGVGLFFTAQPLVMGIASGRRPDFQRDFLQELFYWLVWALLTPLIVAAAERWPLDAQHGRRSVVIHLLIAATLAPLQAVIAFGLHIGEMVLAGALPPAEVGAVIMRTRILVLWGFFTGAYFYWVIVGLYTALRFEREVVRARLDALQSQLQPHFLFNTLNAIAVLTQENSERARQMLFRLGSLLRRSIDEQQHEVPLIQELEFLNEYLEIQRVRFGDRLVVHVDVDRRAADAMVPVFFLQPLVENAIEHGMSEDGTPAEVTVRALKDDRAIVVTVEDNGPGVDDATALREGVGLRNTRERLRRLYGENASLELGRLSADGAAGVRVTIRIPLTSPS